MAARKVSRAKLHEILAFLKGQGVTLNDESIDLLKKKVEEEPISKPTLDKSRELKRNVLFKHVLDMTFVNRSKQIQNIADSNPLLKLIDERKKALNQTDSDSGKPMPENLRKAFHEEERWQPFYPFLGIPPSGQVLKVLETAQQDRPYIGFLRIENGMSMLYTTRRKVDIESLPEVKYYRLREGVFQYEVKEINSLEKGYLKYIYSFHP